MLAPVHEVDPGSDDQVLHRARDQDLARYCQGPDAGGDVDGQAPQVVASHLALAGMQSEVEVEAQSSCGLRKN
jgi:hypothetical protein